MYIKYCKDNNSKVKIIFKSYKNGGVGGTVKKKYLGLFGDYNILMYIEKSVLDEIRQYCQTDNIEQNKTIFRVVFTKYIYNILSHEQGHIIQFAQDEEANSKKITTNLNSEKGFFNKVKLIKKEFQTAYEIFKKRSRGEINYLESEMEIHQNVNTIINYFQRFNLDIDTIDEIKNVFIKHIIMDKNSNPETKERNFESEPIVKANLRFINVNNVLLDFKKLFLYNKDNRHGLNVSKYTFGTGLYTDESTEIIKGLFIEYFEDAIDKIKKQDILKF